MNDEYILNDKYRTKVGERDREVNKNQRNV